MRILLLNQDWFATEMRAAGHEVVIAGLSTSMEVVVPRAVMHIDSILGLLPNGFYPDVILWLDNSAPLLITGMEECDIPCAFYSVDTHHHVDLHAYIAHIFDHVFVAQRDYISAFMDCGTPVSWLPLWAPRYVEPSEDKQYGAAFVGNRIARLNPERVQFFDALEKQVPIYLGRGDYWTIFPHAEIVVNQTVKRDLNFRVFEAMMCGALLLTEASDNGLKDMFNDNEHLVFYEKNNVAEAAEKISQLLADLPRTRKIAKAGREQVLRNHLPRHRAEQVLKVLTSLRKRTPSSKRYFASMINFGAVHTMIESTDTFSATQSIIASLKAAERALSDCEPPGDLEAAHVVINCVRYDRVLRSRAGQELVNLYAEKHPDHKLFAFARIRGCLNVGDIQQARMLAQNFSDDEPTTVFQAAEDAITLLMGVVGSDDGIKSL